RKIGLRLERRDDQLRTPWALTVTFPRLQQYLLNPPTAEDANFRTIRFDVTIHNYQSPETTVTLAGFPWPNNACGQLQETGAPEVILGPGLGPVSSRDFPNLVQVTQRAPVSIAAAPSPPGQKDGYGTNTWLLHIRGVPGKEIIPDQWNDR